MNNDLTQISLDLRAKMEAFLAEVQAEGLVRSDQLRGCSADEIVALEAKYAVSLPTAYRLYLEAMGHDAGDRHSYNCLSYHCLSSYSDVLDLTANKRESIAVWKAGIAHEREDDAAYPAFGTLPVDTFDLPQNALIISQGRDADYLFHYIECSGGEDSPVQNIDMDSEENFVCERYDSLFDFWRVMFKEPG